MRAGHTVPRSVIATARGWARTFGVIEEGVANRGVRNYARVLWLGE